MRTAIIIPTFNEGSSLIMFLNELVLSVRGALGDVHIVIVDDGSHLLPDLQSLESTADIQVHSLFHSINLGQGAALQTGIEYSRNVLDADFFVTMDADNQHMPHDLFPLLARLQNDSLDIVFGNRFHGSKVEGMPLGRLLILRAALIFERMLTRLKLSDAHNGFRVFNRKCADLIQLRQNRMAHATEFKQLVARAKLNYAESPVTIRYTQESLAKGQRNLDGLKIIKDLFRVYLFDSE